MPVIALDIVDCFEKTFLHGRPGSLRPGSIQEREMRKAFYLGIACLFTWQYKFPQDHTEDEFNAEMLHILNQLIDTGTFTKER